MRIINLGLTIFCTVSIHAQLFGFGSMTNLGLNL